MHKKYSFSDFSLEQIFSSMADPVTEINEKYRIVALCGQLAGGRAMGMSGKKSDNDFDVFYKKTKDTIVPPLKNIEVVTICGKEVEVEFNLLDLEKLEQAALGVLGKELKGYPSNFYRSEEEEKANSPEHLLPRWEREEYLFTKFHTLIMGDNYWYGDRMQQFDWNRYYQMERTIDALDYYFIRAYGNYHHFLLKEERINLRRYLNCIWQVLSCERILERGTRPPMHFRTLLEQSALPVELEKRIMEYYELNCNSDIDKKELFCETDKQVNAYIGSLLEEQKVKIENYDGEETLLEMMQNTPKEEKQKGYLIHV